MKKVGSHIVRKRESCETKEKFFCLAGFFEWKKKYHRKALWAVAIIKRI